MSKTVGLLLMALGKTRANFQEVVLRANVMLNFSCKMKPDYGSFSRKYIFLSLLIAYKSRCSISSFERKISYIFFVKMKYNSVTSKTTAAEDINTRKYCF